MRKVFEAQIASGVTELMKASQQGHADEVTRLLAQEGVDVNQGKTSDGMTALMLASAMGHVDVVARLLAHEGVNVNQRTTDQYGMF